MFLVYTANVLLYELYDSKIIDYFILEIKVTLTDRLEAIIKYFFKKD